MQVFFLGAKVALTKTFTRRQDGSVEADSYPHVLDFKSAAHTVSTLSDFHNVLLRHARTGDCLLKGTLSKQLNFESRAGSTDPFTPTEFLVLDIDGLLDHTVDQFLKKLHLHDVSYIIQYSASSGVLPKKGLSCHIFILLDRPILPLVIKQWLVRQNLDHFAAQLTLTRSGCALHYPLDITACQNDKLIYIAPPICIPPALDQFKGARIELVQRSKSFFHFPDDHIDESRNRIDVERCISNLRAAANLPTRKSFVYKTSDDVEYLSKPDLATVTGVKENRGFTYLNINGGDSWGYWHPTDKFEFIHNFKGEPVYKTSEFLPEYYAHIRNKHRPTPSADQALRTYLAFRDPRTDTYYNGWYDPATQEYEIHPTSSKERLTDFLSNNGIKPPKVVPDWTCTFDPTNPKQIDTQARVWNRFRPSKYMLQKHEAVTSVPPTILSIINHVISSDPEVVSAFLNWCAFAYQKRRATGTAWMLQGVPGTGKGILVNYIIRPLFGATNFTARRMEELEDKFNGYMEGCLICYIDEVHIGISKRADMILANLKNQITEPNITIRNMRQMAYEAPNFLNWIMSSNMTTAIPLDKEDRRFSVGVYQTVPLREIYPDTAALVKKIEEELPAFAAFLHTYQVNEDKVRIPVKNEARQNLIDNSLSSLDVVGDAIIKGDLETLASFIPDPFSASALQNTLGEHYRDLIHYLAQTQRDRLTREDLYTIFSFCVGNVPETPAKFSRFLSHRNIKLKKIRIGDRTTRGIDVVWHCDPEWLAEFCATAGLPIPTKALTVPSQPKTLQ
jgi:Family of unknown function (DUF5906)